MRFPHASDLVIVKTKRKTLDGQPSLVVVSTDPPHTVPTDDDRHVAKQLVSMPRCCLSLPPWLPGQPRDRLTDFSNPASGAFYFALGVEVLDEM